jgi:hypothetical protein
MSPVEELSRSSSSLSSLSSQQSAPYAPTLSSFWTSVTRHGTSSSPLCSPRMNVFIQFMNRDGTEDTVTGNQEEGTKKHNGEEEEEGTEKHNRKEDGIRNEVQDCLRWTIGI